MLLAACFLLVLALQLGAHAQCPPGSHQAAANNILLVTDDRGRSQVPGCAVEADEHRQLFSDLFDANVPTPTMDIHSSYDSVLLCISAPKWAEIQVAF